MIINQNPESLDDIRPLVLTCHIVKRRHVIKISAEDNTVTKKEIAQNDSTRILDVLMTFGHSSIDL